MGKLIKFCGQEKLLTRQKRLQWNRVLFLLGMILIGSTYQFLRSQWALPTLWTAMSSQYPVKMASRDLPNSETVTLKSDHQKSSLEMEGSTLNPQVTEDRDKLTLPATVAKKNLNTPRRIVNNSTPVTPETPRRRKKNYTLTTGKQIVKNYTPTTFSRNFQNPTSTTPKRTENYMITPKATMKNNDLMTTRKTVEKKLLATPKRIVENTPGTPKEIIENTPTILKKIIQNAVSPSPTKVVEKTTPIIPKRIKNTSAAPKRVVEKNTPTTPERLLETTPNTPTIPKTLEEKNSNTSKRREEENRTSTASLREGGHNTTLSAMSIVAPTTQIRHCVFVEPVPTVPASLSPSTGMTPFLHEASQTSPEAPKLLDFHPKAEYPPDLFSIEERRQGWVVLHLFGMIYVFVALAIVCDEYFVPALGVITNKLQISEDVAGATFMAAGGSAPELFTSLIGVFISHSNVGIGTIVGSAVFNILFVIGTCALFSREVLNLTWWPLFRDVSFYIFDLMMLILFFLDSLITWWESLMLLMAYAFYVFTMKWNQQLEVWVKEQLNRRTMAKIMVGTGLSEDEDEGEVLGENEDDSEVETRGLEEVENQAAENNEDEGQDETKDEDEPKDQDKDETQGEGEGEGEDDAEDETGVLEEVENQAVKNSEVEGETKGEDESEGPNKDETQGGEGEEEEGDDDSEDEDEEEDEEEEEEETEEPLSLEWPETRSKQAIYLFLLPIIFPLWLTVPDVRKPESRKFFVITFLGSILWIAMFSYLMVWWAHQVGETIGISEEIMGLTILAAGTSIPDLITSVIVARKGLGDMAVSSSVGSNIFDITVGLPAPWLLFSVFNELQPVPVSSNGLFCAIVLLLLMLLFVISSIASCRWRMNKILGFTMFLLYFIFLIVSVMLEDRIISCPISV
uniref:Sodium/potassium/calcium exchanger 1 n=1 Tax=Vombatus ursinus TaxID=29139 RepID=A0A4X2LN74_VOMUR